MEQAFGFSILANLLMAYIISQLLKHIAERDEIIRNIHKMTAPPKKKEPPPPKPKTDFWKLKLQ